MKKNKIAALLITVMSSVCTLPALALDVRVAMFDTATQQPVGNVTITPTKYGLLFIPELHNLTPGLHGFHLHEYPSCGEKGMGAGPHFDPHETEKHLGPYNDDGHLGDLPAITVGPDGKATTPVLAPKLRNLRQLEKHALMIHEGGDNYSDEPAKLGGGGGRMVCGVVD